VGVVETGAAEAEVEEVEEGVVAQNGSAVGVGVEGASIDGKGMWMIQPAASV
jgi:hypothetical protein